MQPSQFQFSILAALLRKDCNPAIEQAALIFAHDSNRRAHNSRKQQLFAKTKKPLSASIGVPSGILSVPFIAHIKLMFALKQKLISVLILPYKLIFLQNDSFSVAYSVWIYSNFLVAFHVGIRFEVIVAHNRNTNAFFDFILLSVPFAPIIVIVFADWFEDKYVIS